MSFPIHLQLVLPKLLFSKIILFQNWDKVYDMKFPQEFGTWRGFQLQ